MKKTLKKYFIPHAENNYHPHILHTKRAVMYGGVFVTMKAIVFLLILALPLDVFVLPDVLAEEEQQIIALTNELRAKKGLPELKPVNELTQSATGRALDMASTEYFDHVGPENRGFRYFLDAVGYKYFSAGENLAMGFVDAESVVAAWIKSPSHYANLIDAEYLDTGVGLSSGYFDGVPTVYVAEHFGAPEKVAAVAGLDGSQVGKSASPASSRILSRRDLQVKTEDEAEALPDAEAERLADGSSDLGEKQVAGITLETVALVPVNYDPANSRIFWEDLGDRVRLSAVAAITGEVKSARVVIGDISVPLAEEGDRYLGSAVVQQTANEFFAIILTPAIEIESASGAVLRDTVAWNSVKVVSPTPFQKYTRAKRSLGLLGNIIDVSKGIYLSFIIFFSLALALMIVIEIKKQRPHIIAQTAGLIGLLLYLYVM